ncbi:FMN-binding negative transcriptional regulator [Hoyosella sp. G463]|uniref:FMN-binding negative transcriptional regulator n=1 Tax=Lolliginicoccus lacisalsi TaxID=2742202 RepID=A0A927JEF3_9ACTN|nr:FMN-binding negative transcriptional regulator [Lolliginicoccus lacisalsi]MBD8506862.1 FMN-binding negative transcriptional regulator [Lolliginicoccus lacisalsi]
MSPRWHWSELLVQYPLCQIVTVGLGSGRVATSRVPLYYTHRDGTDFVAGHIARVNPHWKLWAEPSVTVCLIDGAHAYVSPESYAVPSAVPTWNYCTATLHGEPQVMDATEAVDSLLSSLAVFDPKLRSTIGPTERAFYERARRAIVPFQIAITRAELKEKVSAARSMADQDGIRADLARRGGADDYLAMLDWLAGLPAAEQSAPQE